MKRWLNHPSGKQVRAYEDSVFERIRRQLIKKYWAQFIASMPGKDREFKASEKLIGLGAYTSRTMHRLIDDRAGSSAQVLRQGES